MRTRSMILALAGGLSLSRPALAGAPDPAARAFDEGVARMKAGRHDEGCPLVAESYRLDPLPGTLFTLAECEALRGRIATAFRLYGEFAQRVAATPAGKRARYLRRARRAEAQREALGPRIPELTLLLPPSAPAGTVVERDAERLAAERLGAPQALDPGEHEIVTRAPGGPRVRVVVSLSPGERKAVMLEVSAPPPIAPRLAVQTPVVPAAPRAAPEATSGRRVATYAAAGVGAGGLLVGAIFGAIAIGQASVIRRECSGEACTRAGKDAADAIARTGAASSIGFGVGVAGAAAAVLLRLTEPAKRPGPGVRVGVLGVEGAW